MTTQRQGKSGRGTSDLPSLHGSYLHLDVDTGTKDITTLRNTVLRGEFRRSDGTRVVLAAGPRCALYALLSYQPTDALWRLQMDHFAGEFREKRDTVYRWIRILEDEGFVTRRRVNNPDTGMFEWHMHATVTPRATPVTDVNPQVGPSPHFGGDGAAPPVDRSDNRRSDHPHKSPGWVNPSMVKPLHGHPYRETKEKELPASTPVPAHMREAEEADTSSRPEQPTLSLVRPPIPAGIPADVAAEPDWVDWVWGLLDKDAVRAAGPLRPKPLDVARIAVAAQVAADQFGWTRHQLATRVLLVRLGDAEHLGSVWAWRLHPANLGPPPVEGKKTWVEQGRKDQDAMPTAERRAQIRAQVGPPRGLRWNLRMGGST